MPGIGHERLTAYALALLPPAAARLLGAGSERLIRACCHYPDWYFGIGTPRHEQAARYHFETDGIQFHYLPDTPVAPAYRYWRLADDRTRLEPAQRPPNLNWHHAQRGFRYYLTRSADAIREGALEDACGFLGCLLHVLQDAGVGLHSLEGPDGTDLFVLDRLFPETDTPGDLPSMAALDTGADPGPSVLDGLAPPRVLGLDPDEAVFHLYTRYVRAAGHARRMLFDWLARRRYAGTPDLPLPLPAFYRNVLPVCADVLLTACCLAGAADPGDTGHLDRVLLSDMAPVERPWNLSHYRFLTLLRDRALGDDLRPGPLRLAFARPGGRREIRTYERGIGMGAHYEAHLAYAVPSGIYDRLTCAIGLDAACADRPTARVRVRLLQEGAVARSMEFSPAHPAEEIELTSPGGRLELEWRHAAGMDANTRLVWAEPRLYRRPSPA